MNIWILNKNLERIKLVDAFQSFIWTDRYWEAGDFELYIPASSDLTQIVKKDYFVVLASSEHSMMVDKIVLDTDEEIGSHLTITGHSLEYILHRRLIWGSKTFKEGSNLQNGIETLMNENAINPSDTKRKINGLKFIRSEDPEITKLTFEAQYNGANLYDTISTLCKDNNIGFKIVLTDNNEFEFSLYKGADRSYEQTKNPYVIFSPNFDNILNSNYVETDEDYYNVALVTGTGPNNSKPLLGVGLSVEGLNRRELFIEAGDISAYNDDGTQMSEAAYKAKLKQRGEEELAKTKKTKVFTGEIDTTQQFIYEKDFFMGDILQIENEYGFEGLSRMVELVTAYSDKGVSRYPGFINLDEKGDPLE